MICLSETHGWRQCVLCALHSECIFLMHSRQSVFLELPKPFKIKYSITRLWCCRFGNPFNFSNGNAISQKWRTWLRFYSLIAQLINWKLWQIVYNPTCGLYVKCYFNKIYTIHVRSKIVIRHRKLTVIEIGI